MSDVIDLSAAERRMRGAVESVKHNFATIRTGRANPSLLDRIEVEAYGTRMPLRSVANVGAPEPRLLTVTPFDPNTLKNIERAIGDSDIGLTGVAQELAAHSGQLGNGMGEGGQRDGRGRAVRSRIMRVEVAEVVVGRLGGGLAPGQQPLQVGVDEVDGVLVVRGDAAPEAVALPGLEVQAVEEREVAVGRGARP